MKSKMSIDEIVRSAIGEKPLETVEQVVEVPAAKIRPNERNFYGMVDLDDLAASIELTGLLHPIILRPDADGYTIVDGERRYRAMSEILHKETVPAIIRPRDDLTADLAPIIEELSLLEANRQNRKLTDSEISKAAARYKELLARLKEAGYDIPGRLRDVAAEALSVSASKLARLNKIRTSLAPQYLALFDEGKMNESTAYALARQPLDRQEMIAGTPAAAQRIGRFEVEARAVYAGHCLQRRPCPYGGDCDYGEAMYRHGKGKCEAQQCRVWEGHDGCCKSCDLREGCGSVCPKAQADIKAEQAARQEWEESKAAHVASERAQRIQAADADWQRVSEIRDLARISPTDPRLPTIRGQSWEAFDANRGALLLPDAGYTLAEALTIQEAVQAADVLGVSLDRLVGRDFTPTAPDDETADVTTWGGVQVE